MRYKPNHKRKIFQLKPHSSQLFNHRFPRISSGQAVQHATSSEALRARRSLICYRSCYPAVI